MGHPFWPLQGSCLSQTVPSLLPSAALAAPASLSSLDIHHTCLPVFFPFLSIPTLPLIEMHHNVFFYNTVPLWYSIFNVIDIMLFLAQNHLRGLFKNSCQQLWVVEEGKPGQGNVNNRVELERGKGSKQWRRPWKREAGGGDLNTHTGLGQLLLLGWTLWSGPGSVRGFCLTFLVFHCPRTCCKSSWHKGCYSFYLITRGLWKSTMKASGLLIMWYILGN